jgi:transcription elongation factor Elf1
MGNQVTKPCPKCGNKVTFPLEKLRRGAKFTCPGCGQGFELAGEGLDEIVADAKRRIVDAFNRGMKR